MADARKSEGPARPTGALSLAYAGLGAGFAYNPYMQVWMRVDLGLPPAALGALTASTFATNALVVPAMGMAFDRVRSAAGKRALFAALICGAGGVHVLYTAFLGPRTPRPAVYALVLLGEALAYSAQAQFDALVLLQLGADKLRFGRVRLWFALSLGLAVAAVGLARPARMPLGRLLFPANAAIFCTLGLCMWAGPPTRACCVARAARRSGYWTRQSDEEVAHTEATIAAATATKAAPWGAAAPEAEGAPAGATQSAGAARVQPSTPLSTRLSHLARAAGWRGVGTCAVVCALGISAKSLNAFVFLRIRSLGGSTRTMGLATLINVLAELPFFYQSKAIIQTLGPQRVLYLGLCCYVVRALWYAAVRTPWLVLVVEPLHGVTFALVWATLVSIFAHAAPGLEGTAQGVLNGLFNGVGGTVGASVGGALFEHEPRALFLALAGLGSVTALGMGVSTAVCGVTGARYVSRK